MPCDDNSLSLFLSEEETYIHANATYSLCGMSSSGSARPQPVMASSTVATRRLNCRRILFHGCMYIIAPLLNSIYTLANSLAPCNPREAVVMINCTVRRLSVLIGCFLFPATHTHGPPPTPRIIISELQRAFVLIVLVLLYDTPTLSAAAAKTIQHFPYSWIGRPTK